MPSSAAATSLALTEPQKPSARYSPGLPSAHSPFASLLNMSPASPFPDERPAPPQGSPSADAPPTIRWVRSARARRLRLTLRHDGVAVLTLPNRSDENEARRFLTQQEDWLIRARARLAAKPRAPQAWTLGASLLWRGEPAEIRLAREGDRPAVSLAADVFRVATLAGDLRPALETGFARLAKIELPARAWELAAETKMPVKMVRVRNQRTRWGSCSTGGVISLNYRLVRMPDSVRDYVIYHELMHLREMNHSSRFWRRVEDVCPWWQAAEQWLKQNGPLVGL